MATFKTNERALPAASPQGRVGAHTRRLRVNDERVVKGTDRIDDDHRGGWLTYGVEVPRETLETKGGD